MLFKGILNLLHARIMNKNSCTFSFFPILFSSATKRLNCSDYRYINLTFDKKTDYNLFFIMVIIKIVVCCTRMKDSNFLKPLSSTDYFLAVCLEIPFINGIAIPRLIKVTPAHTK